MGPQVVADRFLAVLPDAEHCKVILYSSLARTDRGHTTDGILYEPFEGRDCEVFTDPVTPTEFHPNTRNFIAYSAGREYAHERYYSIGGRKDPQP